MYEVANMCLGNERALARARSFIWHMFSGRRLSCQVCLAEEIAACGNLCSLAYLSSDY